MTEQKSCDIQREETCSFCSGLGYIQEKEEDKFCIFEDRTVKTLNLNWNDRI